VCMCTQARTADVGIDTSRQNNSAFPTTIFFLAVKIIYCGKFHAPKCLWDKLSMG
jgi:hypothetical protein